MIISNASAAEEDVEEDTLKCLVKYLKSKNVSEDFFDSINSSSIDGIADCEFLMNVKLTREYGKIHKKLKSNLRLNKNAVCIMDSIKTEENKILIMQREAIKIHGKRDPKSSTIPNNVKSNKCQRLPLVKHIKIYPRNIKVFSTSQRQRSSECRRLKSKKGKENPEIVTRLDTSSGSSQKEHLDDLRKKVESSVNKAAFEGCVSVIKEDFSQ